MKKVVSTPKAYKPFSLPSTVCYAHVMLQLLKRHRFAGLRKLFIRNKKLCENN